MNRKKKRFLGAVAAIVAVPVLVAPAHYQAAYDKPFTDVSSKNVYYDIIHSMRDQGIIHGYEDGSFKPSETLSRKHAAALINRAVDLPKTTTFVKPKDLSVGNPNFNDIKALMEAGLLKTNSKGNINLNEPLTRGEMAKILTVAFDLKVKADYTFSDVVGSEYEEYVKALYSNGVTTGYEDATFKTNGSLTRAHYAVFMHRSMNLDSEFVAQPIKPSENSGNTGNPTTGKDPEKNENKNETPKPTTPNKEPDKKPSQNVKDYPDDKVTNNDVIKLEDMNVPGGFENRFDLLKQQQETAKKLQRQNVIRRESGTSYRSLGDDYTKVIKNIASKVNASESEIVQIINYAEGTGNVYDGGNFYLYLDFTRATVVYGYQ